MSKEGRPYWERGRMRRDVGERKYRKRKVRMEIRRGTFWEKGRVRRCVG